MTATDFPSVLVVDLEAVENRTRQSLPQPKWTKIANRIITMARHTLPTLTEGRD